MVINFFPVHPKEISLQGGSEKREGGMGGACYICCNPKYCSQKQWKHYQKQQLGQKYWKQEVMP